MNNNHYDLRINDISDVTLAAILIGYEMLEHYLTRYDREDICRYIVMSGNVKALKWAEDNWCLIISKYIGYDAAEYGHLILLKYLH